ncbi:MAG: alpha/beta hydrolase [Bacteroidetes bacterium]|nr:alpha/beta hydrolase [Bacteroidota bacterium]
MKLLVAVLLVQFYLFNRFPNNSAQENECSQSPGNNISVKELNIDILSSDGIKLKATYYSPEKPGPGMLLLHECDMDRKSWTSLAVSLANSGIHVLTFDYRGYGETPAQGSLYEHIATDVDSALAKLMSQPEVDKKRVAVGGASCGVYNSIQLAMRNDHIKALFFLTGPIPQQGVAYIKSHPDMPILAIENGDEISWVKELDDIIKNSKNPASTMKAYTNGSHGVPIFKKHPEIIATVTNWLAKVLNA